MMTYTDLNENLSSHANPQRTPENIVAKLFSQELLYNQSAKRSFWWKELKFFCFVF